MSNPTSPPRKRGGQPGNHNARKHGLTPRLKPPEYRLTNSQQVDLTAEIHILRQQLERLNQAAIQAPTITETMEIARVIALTASSLARLIRAQVVVFSADAPESSSEEEWRQQLTTIIERVAKERMGELDPDEADFPPPRLSLPFPL